MKIEISNGEYLDRISILMIKSEKIKDKNKLKNIEHELETLLEHIPSSKLDLESDEFKELYKINKNLWDIEDKLREREKSKQFDEEFIDLARKVYLLNDKRALIKRIINIESNSSIIEEKLYYEY